MLISIDQSAWEQFMCINEVKNSAKQSNPATECKASHMWSPLMTEDLDPGTIQ